MKKIFSRIGMSQWMILAWPAACLVIQVLDPIPQDPAYHDFAPSGRWWAIRNFWNVVTNLALVFAGLWGLRTVLVRKTSIFPLAEGLFFLAVTLSGFGSAYYHHAPNDQTLFWDRLPMAIAFMAFFVALFAHCFDRKLAGRIFWPALSFGLAGVVYWAYTETTGAGDLRYYAVAQFLPMILIPSMLIARSPSTLAQGWVWSMLPLYGMAKLCEVLDHALAAMLPLMLTGHALKHLFAAAAALAFARALHPSGSTKP